MEDDKIPLCVDLDGTLIRTDLLVESLLILIKQKPWLVFVIPVWLLRGKSVLKDEIASRVDLNVQTLPYQSGFVEFLRKEHAAGRPLILATASHRKFADGIAKHLGVFTKVHATEDGTNLAGRAKRDILVKHYGIKGFDYAGNSRADVPVWGMARQAIVVNPGRGVLQGARNQCPISQTFTDRHPSLKTYAKALRVHQWLKNILVFIPMLLAHQISHVSLWANGLLAFISFSLCASSVYLLNDLLDLSADRLHPRKRLRPFASGALSMVQGIVLIPLLLLAAFTIAALWLPTDFVIVLVVYYLLTVSYSFWLKAVVLLDALLLAGLYTIRIIGGMAATQIGPSFWLLTFSIFLFFSLALIKRYSELLALKQRGQLTTHGRGYHVEDLVMLMGFGVASGFMAVLVSALYINSDKVKVLYQHPAFLWLVSPILLYWISRIWLIAHRGGMHDDPVVFAAKDKGSWAVAAVIGGFLWLAAI
ncbi:UbiA prenyltransferase [Acidithiobacillus ferrivorans SS3]|uniref:UbiA prenyltransferase n=1 Tax=Acidithiobacillus ferrivorans SS3 TaxID=743299 RepID=G0JUB8_9PROT|nr:UbiA family prenyltransferase [Acidithiobacillus ferrivorans]AEM49087.1 UbiA prenyltransferase [Acidithiobacillus ferrivorans SS3]